MVDDDPLVARSVARVVTLYTGLSVRCAHTQAEACQAIGTPPTAGVVLLDYDLGPQSPDGVGVLGSLRQRGFRAPAAFVSSMPPWFVQRRLREAGLEPAPCFQKPVAPALLKEWIGKYAKLCGSGLSA